MKLGIILFVSWLVLVCVIVAFFHGADPRVEKRDKRALVDSIRQYGAEWPLLLLLLSATLLCSGCGLISTPGTRYAESEFLDPVTEQPPEFKNE